MAYHRKTDRTRDIYERVLRVFESSLGDPSRNPVRTARSVDDATYRDCVAWTHILRNRDVVSSTVVTHVSYLHRLYVYMTQADVLDSNPMSLVIGEMDKRTDINPT